MEKLKKVKTMLSDPDIKEFIKFLAIHPGNIFNIYKQNKYENMPEYIKESVHGQAFHERDKLVLRAVPISAESGIMRDGDKVSEKVIQARLAGTDVVLNLESIDWNQSFADPEDMAAFHRFIWLYKWVFESLTTGNQREFYEIVVNVINSWIENESKRSKEQSHFEVWQTYTVAERVINWSVLLAVTSEKEFGDRKVIDSIIEQLEYIRCHFEYYGERFTGNHFCNDGRALYIAGSLLSIKYYMDLGRKIILHEFDRVVTDRYFLREGSVHYQFLYTKWFVDLYWIASTCEDTDFQEKLRQCLERLLVGCNYFLVKSNSEMENAVWTMPYIGDISPDYPPTWLLGVPWTAKYLLDGSTFEGLPEEKGYHTFFLLDKKIIEEGSIQDIPSGIHASDWGKITTKDFVLFAHVNHSLYPNNLTGHFHHDSGSFVLFADGRPFFVDCGREDYGVGGLSLHEKDYTGHNICSVDSMNPEINMRTFFTAPFLESYGSRAPVIYTDYEHKSITMSIEGYNRKKGVGKHTRRILLKEGAMKIADRIDGSGEHEITLLFHVSHEVDASLKEKNVFLDNGWNHYKLSFSVSADSLELIDGSVNDVYGHCASEYGDHSFCSTLLYKKMVKLPWKINTKLEKI